MPPEQARGLWDEVDAQSDLWAVGALMFTLLSGSNVHKGRTTNELLLAAMTTPAAPLATLEPKVHAAVAAVVDRALAFEKPRRWPDARAMQNAVRHAYQEMHRAPLSTAPKLTVPPSVADRTLPSADVIALAPAIGSVGTGPAVVSGRTGVALRQAAAGIPRGALVAVGVAGVGAVLALSIIVIGLVASRTRGTPAAASVGEVTALPGEATGGGAPERGTAGAPVTPSVPPVVALEDLPTAQPKKLGAPKPDAGGSAKPVVPGITDWKEPRR
jgi:serine/threonine-protein kinase